MKRFLAAALAFFIPVAAHADDYPAHGLYRVSIRPEDDGRRFCELKVLLNETEQGQQRLFALSIQDDGPHLMRIVLASNRRELLNAKAVKIKIDGLKLIDFVPIATTSKDGTTTIGFGTKDLRQIAALENGLDTGGEILQIVAGDFFQQISTRGLPDTMKDFGKCRASISQAGA